MKLKYEKSRLRETIPLRVRKDFADLVQGLAEKRNVSKSKLLDEVLAFGLERLKEEKISEEEKNAGKPP